MKFFTQLIYGKYIQLSYGKPCNKYTTNQEELDRARKYIQNNLTIKH